LLVVLKEETGSLWRGVQRIFLGCGRICHYI
jgi:hypothetical protein